MKRGKGPLLIAFLALAGDLALVGCQSQSVGVTRAGSAQVLGPGRLTPAQIQSLVMSFCDSYTDTISQVARDLEESVHDPVLARQIHSMALSSISGAVTIAAEANPAASMLDMAALVTMQRIAFDRYWLPEVFGEAGRPWYQALQRLEADIWQGVAQIATVSEQEELRRTIVAFMQQNPSIRVVSRYRLEDITKSRGISHAGPAGSTSIFRMLYIDPLANLGPAAQELMQSRLLGERVFFYAKRLPFLLEWHLENLMYAALARPETQQLVADVHTFAQSAEELKKAVADFPKEREAAIAQIQHVISTERDSLLQALDARRESMGKLAVDLRQTIEAGTALSDSLQKTIALADTLSTRLGAGRQSPATRPFDIGEYRAAINDATTTLRELNRSLATAQELIAPPNRPPGRSPVADLAKTTRADVEAVVDRLFVRALIFIAIFFAGVFVTSLLIGIVRRRLREGERPGPQDGGPSADGTDAKKTG